MHEDDIDLEAMDDTERAAYAEFVAGGRRLDAGDYSEAVTCYRRATRILPSKIPSWLGLAKSLCAAHRFAEARRAIDEALRLDPECEDGHFLLGGILRSQKKLPEAAQAYEAAIRLATKPPQDALYNLGLTLSDLKRYPEAYDFLSRALELDGCDAATLFELAVVEGKLGSLDRAIEHYFHAGDLDPNLWNDIAGDLRELKLFSVAAQAERNEIAARPENAWAYANLGHILKHGSRFEEAIREYERAVELDPGALAAVYPMALCLIRLRRYDEAERALVKALEIAPRDKAVQNSLAALRRRKAKS